MSYDFLSNVGSADEIRKKVSALLADNDQHGTVFLLLDKARTVLIDRTQRRPNEVAVFAKDIEDGATVILHLPFDSPTAQATIITTNPKGEQ